MKLNLLGGQNSKRRLKKIKYYLSSPLVLKAPRRSVPFKLYIAAEDKIVGAVLTQETKGKEHVVTCINRRLIDAETWYTCKLSIVIILLRFSQSIPYCTFHMC